MSKDPAFLFYSKDWLEGTAELMPNEKGVYIDLLCYQHQRGFLPSDNQRLARLVGLPVPEFEEIWKALAPKFDRTVDRTVNKRLEAVMNERTEKGHTNRITGTFAAVLRGNELSKKDYIEVKKAFKVKDFTDVPTERLTERLTEWLSERLKSIGNGNGNGNEDVDEVVLGFKKPTLEEVRAYCLDRKNSVDPNKWLDFYESKGWMIGKNKMKDWKAAIRTWETPKAPVKDTWATQG